MKMTRALGLCAGLALAATSLTACADRPGVAATVGPVSVSQSQLQKDTAEVVGRAATSPNPPRAIEVARSILTAKIRHHLAQEAAKSAGITVTEETVNQAIGTQSTEAMAQQLGVPAADARQAVRDIMVLQQLAAKNTGGVPHVEVSVTFVMAPSAQEAAVQRAKYQQNPAAMTGQQTTVGSLAGALALVPYGLFTAPVGSVLVVPEQGNYLVVRIDKRTVTEGADLNQVLKSVRGGQVQIVSLLLAPEASKQGVVVNPRYGVWDPQTLQVVADTTVE